MGKKIIGQRLRPGIDDRRGRPDKPGMRHRGEGPPVGVTVDGALVGELRKTGKIVISGKKGETAIGGVHGQNERLARRRS